MNIGMISAMPMTTVYNPNTVTPNSLNKIAPIKNDTSHSHVDFTGLLDEANYEANPLGRGETKNFADVLASQMAMSNRNKAMFDL